MKYLLLTAMISVSTSLFSGSPASGCDDEMNLYHEVVDMVNDETAIKELNVNGMAEITFVIDENHAIHIISVITKDNLYEFHIREKLEGTKVNYCLDQHKTYTILVNAKLV